MTTVDLLEVGDIAYYLKFLYPISSGAILGVLTSMEANELRDEICKCQGFLFSTLERAGFLSVLGFLVYLSTIHRI